jgi:4-carboxymuconolactone decarboxylase
MQPIPPAPTIAMRIASSDFHEPKIYSRLRPFTNMRRKIMAQSAGSPARERIRGTVPKLAEIADTLIYGEIWERPHLSKRDRSLIVCGALMAMGRYEQLRGHLDRALNNGCTQDEIAELITHLAFYSGWPTAMTAATLAKEVFEAR